MAACRFCCTCLDAMHRYGLFSLDAMWKDIPGRFSKLLQLPVTPKDGLSKYYCRKCISKLNSVEKTIAEMRSLASSCYRKAGYDQPPPCSSSSSPTTAREHTRKRVKDTSGDGASPHTTQARPPAKRTLGALGRRLTFDSDSGE